VHGGPSGRHEGQRDEQAFSLPDEALAPALREKLRAYLLKRVGRPEVAEDLVQETLLKAGRVWGREPVRCVEGWLLCIARNLAADYFRAQREEVEFEETLHGGTDSNGVMAGEERWRERLATEVRAVLTGLPMPDYLALALTEFADESQVELAERFGITISAAKSRVQRARAEMVRRLAARCRIQTDGHGHVVECVWHDEPGNGA